MPRIRRKNTRFPKGFEVLEEVLDQFEDKMRDAMLDTHEGKRRAEATWPIIRIHHQRSRYIYNMFKEKKINRKVYEFCIREKYADAYLVAKWKKVLFCFTEKHVFSIKTKLKM